MSIGGFLLLHFQGRNQQAWSPHFVWNLRIGLRDAVLLA
jgi:hypothetical protein